MGPTSLLNKRPLINNKEGATAAAWGPPSSSSYNTNFDHSLNFWKQQNDLDPTTSSASIDPYVEGTLANEKDDVPLSTIALVGSSLFSFTYVVQRLQVYLNTDCLNAGRGSNICTADYFCPRSFLGLHNLASSHPSLNLLLEGQDHQEEVCVESPWRHGGDGAQGINEKGQRHADDVQDETNCGPNDPRLHEGDVSLKYKDVTSGFTKMQLKAMIIKKKITRDANIETDRSGAMDKAAGDDGGDDGTDE